MEIARGLIIENAPPLRLIRHGDHVVGQYAIGSPVEERFMLLRLVDLGWVTALDLAPRWGLHRNTLGNWAWRYQHFGLDGLVPGRLPGRKERLQQILAVAQAVVQRRGRRVSAAEVGREIEAAGFGTLPRSTLAHLRLTLLLPRQPSIWDGLDAGDEEGGTAAPAPDGPAAEIPAPESGDAPGAAEGPSLPGMEVPSGPDGADEDNRTVVARAPVVEGEEGGTAAPAPDGPAAEMPAPESGDAPGAAEGPSLPDAEGPSGPDGDEEGNRTCAPLPGAAVVDEVPPAPAPGDVRMQHAGLALVLPQAQALLEPLQDFLEEKWGGRAWYYHPAQLLLAFLLYVLSGYRNPEQVKAAPAPDFGPLLGRRRAPACVTLRRRLPPLAHVPALVEELQARIAQRYLELGWVVAETGGWLLDGHFAPYHGKQPWGKAWWPQRRLAYPGRFSEWVHDLRGRPLFLRVAQGFELFADQIPLIADGLRALLTAAGRAEPVVLVFDRGGYNAEVFRSLNARGVGWVTWLRAKVALPVEAFTAEAELPAAGPGQPPRVHYACFTCRVPGCHDEVAG
ncbi:MAG: hypothetical protein OWV35_00770, partial [Firmicutes bacterium]|nr:hypothetical protein [Bacillota bacterium]